MNTLGRAHNAHRVRLEASACDPEGRELLYSPFGLGFRAYALAVSYRWGLETHDPLGLQAFGTLLYFELHGLPLVEALIAVGLDGRIVDEDVLTGLTLDEPIALCSVKPLYCTLLSSHFCVLLID